MWGVVELLSLSYSREPSQRASHIEVHALLITLHAALFASLPERPTMSDFDDLSLTFFVY